MINKAAVKQLVQGCARLLGVEIIRTNTLERLMDSEFLESKLRMLLRASEAGGDVNTLWHSRSQVQQDLFVLLALSFKRDGFFVEFGATDGKKISNTFLLEKHFSWSGILAEPGRSWRGLLKRNRDAIIDSRAVWRVSGEQIRFVEQSDPQFSGIDSSSKSAWRWKLLKEDQSYLVETVNLTDLLESHAAPSRIDYLSIDTEGSELEILLAHDFDRYRFSVITVEHNFTHNRELIYDFLVSRGYSRVAEDVSRHDDFYLDREIRNPEDLEPLFGSSPSL